MAAAAIGEDICYPAPQRLISVERGRNPSRTLSMLHWHISAETRRLAPMQTSSEYRIAWSGQSTTTQLRYVEQLSTRKHGMQTVLMLWLTSAGTSLRSTSMESTARDRRRDGRDDGSLQEVVSHPPAAQHLHLGFRQLQELLSAPDRTECQILGATWGNLDPMRVRYSHGEKTPELAPRT